MEQYLLNALSHFKINGDVLSIERYGNGHINTTYLVVTTNQRYILQIINHNLFKEVDKLMNNIDLVTSFIREHFENQEVLTIIKTNENKTYYHDNEKYYRVYDFIEKTICLQIVSNEEEYYESARAFGEFAMQLANFDASLLYDVLPHFHNTVVRYDNFLKAIENNKANRLNEVSEEIKFVKDRKDFCSTIVSLIESKQMPLKVTHNDTKLNNVLLDEKTLKGKAIIDLDTVMPGSICYDFGDSIRSGCNSSYEDDPNLDNVFFRTDLFEIYVKGYLSSLGSSITPIEKDNLVNGAIMMTFECGMRFLTDYLDGDTYFKTSRKNQNLDRTHTQFKLVTQMEDNKDQLQAIVDKYYNQYCR